MNRSDFILLIPDHIPHPARVAIARVLEEEQGKSHLVHDRGGYTNWGISSRWYPQLPVSELSASDAAKIYFTDYWCFNQCHSLPAELALLVFDTAVNQGGDFARKTLQKLLKVKVDGVIGPKTIKAAPAHTDLILLTSYTRMRCKRYCDLAQSDHTQITFIEGWIDRALDVLSDAQVAVLYGDINP